MPSTITLQNTINWALTFLRYQPVTIGTANEPSITSANTILQTILGPPFAWRWNRGSTTAVTVAGTQDVTAAITSFGFLEKATVTDSNGIVTELEFRDILSPETASTAKRARPTFIATQIDDNAGNYTFRLQPVPDAVYTLTLIFQKQATLFTTPSGSWAPIPDYLSYIYNRGFLALSFELADDQRFQVEHVRFLASLLGASQGLSEMQKNIFLGGVLNTQVQAQVSQLRTQQAMQARGT